ncbi:MAG TPA: TonB-dependent receptor plug domain-containing protein, partial [Bacteroidia bacterium]|nr:TonB-dependent receptor plug domain-containing protein [Bacteroidia bacterium]
PAQQISSTARDSVSFYDMSLEDLMKVEVTVATSKALTPRESPGIITFITEDEIRKSGATDLIELLQKVPGFDFGVDVEGVIGLGVRGNWAHEGKVLMLLDGHELNEDLFSAIVLGAHYSVSSIKQIEIIRGPGSAVYGGNAEYAVINIITKQAGSGNGIAVNTTYSQMSRQYATRNISLSAMKPLGDVQVNLSAFFNESNRSQNDFTDNYGSSYNMAENSGIHTAQGKLDLTWKKLKLSAFADQYHLLQRDGYENALSKTYPTDFNSYHILGEYEVHVNDKLSLLPTVKFKHQTPWNFEGTSLNDEFVPYSVSVESFLGQLKANYDINSSINLITGLEGCKQIAAQRIDSTYFSNGSGKFEINNMAAYAQMLIRSKFANITFGARYNANDRFADAFVPRIGLTRVFNKWH